MMDSAWVDKVAYHWMELETQLHWQACWYKIPEGNSKPDVLKVNNSNNSKIKWHKLKLLWYDQVELSKGNGTNSYVPPEFIPLLWICWRCGCSLNHKVNRYLFTLLLFFNNVQEVYWFKLFSRLRVKAGDESAVLSVSFWLGEPEVMCL